MRKLTATFIAVVISLGFATPAESDSTKWTAYQKTLATYSGSNTALSSLQKSQIRTTLEKAPKAEKFICTGIRYYDQPMSVNIMVRKRAKEACAYAKQLKPSLSTWFQNKPTKARSYAGKVLLTVKSPDVDAQLDSGNGAEESSSIVETPRFSNPEFRIAANAKTGLTGKTWPVLRPQLATSECSMGALELRYESEKRFIPGGEIRYSIAGPDGIFGNPVISRISYVEAYSRSEPRRKVGPQVVPVELEICVSDVPRGDEQYALVKVTLQRESGSTFDGVEVRVDFAEPTEGLLMEEMKTKCLNGQNLANFPVAQVSATRLTRNPYTGRITGTVAAIEGTVFRNSVALKNVEIRFFQEFKNSSGATQYPGYLIGKATTDSLGQFEASLPIKRDGLSSSETMVTAFVSKSAQPLGNGATVIGGASFRLYFDWLLTPGYYTGNKYDLPPKITDDCSSTYFNYLDIATGDDEDDRNRLLRYVVLHEANRWFNGYKDSSRKYTTYQCRDESWGAACNYFESGVPAPKATEFGSLGTKCWHRKGHTRTYKNGKTTYVRSHKACR